MTQTQEQIADQLQAHSYTLDTLATLGGQILITCKQDSEQQAYFINASLPRLLDTIQQVGQQLDAISADMKGFNDNE